MTRLTDSNPDSSITRWGHIRLRIEREPGRCWWYLETMEHVLGGPDKIGAHLDGGEGPTFCEALTAGMDALDVRRAK